MERWTREQLRDKLTGAIQAARVEGQRVSRETDDGGTCNFDSPVLMLPRIHEAFVADIAKRFQCDAWTWRPGLIIISGCTYGQGNARTKGAEAARKVFEQYGFDTTMYYQMD